MFTGRDYAAIEKEFAGRGYGEFKLAVAEVVKDAFAPIQAEYKRILADKAYLDGVLTEGARRAAAICGPHSDKSLQKSRFFCKFNRILAYISLQIVKIFFLFHILTDSVKFCIVISMISGGGIPAGKGVEN